MPPGKDYSRINQGRKELIDHVPNARRNAPSSNHAPVLATFANV
jgi:hypothetical protein